MANRDRKLILHIGMHKTGSTALQRTLAANRPALAEAGADYLDFGVNHSKSVARLFYMADGAKIFHRADSPTVAETRSELGALLERRTRPLTIVSGERFSTFDADEAAQVGAYFHRFFDRIEVVCFVRPPKSHVNSAAQERLKRGETVDEIAAAPRPPAYGCLDHFDRPDDAMTVTAEIYRPGIDVVGRFLDLCGLPAGSFAGPAAERINPSLSMEAAIILNAVNRTGIFRESPVGRRRIIAGLREIGGDRFLMPDAFLAEVAGTVATDRIGYVAGIDFSGTDIVGGAYGFERFDHLDGDQQKAVDTLCRRIEAQRRRQGAGGAT